MIIEDELNAHITRDVANFKKIFKDVFSIKASDEDCQYRGVCAAVSTTAAGFAGAGMVTLIKKINKLPAGACWWFTV